MGLWNSHTSLGNIFGSLIAGAFVSSNWGLSFTVPGMIIAGVGFILFLFMVPRPEDVGLPGSSPGQVSREDPDESDPLMEDKEEEEEQDRHVIEDSQEAEQREERAIGFVGALKIPGVVEFSLCLFFSKLVSYTFLYWLPNYIHSTAHVDAQESAILSTIFDLGGIIGGTMAGIVSDTTHRPATTCLVMLILAVPTMYTYSGLVTNWCPITANNGIPVHDKCFNLNIFLTLVTGREQTPKNILPKH